MVIFNLKNSAINLCQKMAIWFYFRSVFFTVGSDENGILHMHVPFIVVNRVYFRLVF